MQYEQPKSVCSVRHLFNFVGEDNAKPVLNTLIRQSFRLSPQKNYKNPPGTRDECLCRDCETRRKEFYKKYPTIEEFRKDKKENPLSIETWNYRLLLTFQDSDQVYFKQFLIKNQFLPKFEYIGYQGGVVTVWGLHIPTYLEDNKIPLDSKSFLLEDLLKDHKKG